MKKIDIDIKKSVSAGEPLPIGGHIAKILNVELKEYTWGDVLVFSFDITDGEYKDFFKKKYQESQDENKKWKGTYRLTVPQEDNQWYESQKKAFGHAIACIEESNDGYRWDWDETKLKNKLVGVSFRNFEWEIDGKSGWSTKCGMFLSVDDVKNGKYKVMKDIPLKNKQAPYSKSEFVIEEISDEDIPF